MKHKFVKATVISGAVIAAIALSSCIKKEGGAGEVSQIQYTVPANYMPNGTSMSPNGIGWLVSGTTVMASCPAGFAIPAAVTGPISTNDPATLTYTGTGVTPSVLESNLYKDSTTGLLLSWNGHDGGGFVLGDFGLDPTNSEGGINTTCVPEPSVDDWTWP